METDYAIEDKFVICRRPIGQDPCAGVTAFLTVQEGCDSSALSAWYPTRALEVSRPVSQNRGGAEKLVEGGVREITLLATDVTPGTARVRMARMEPWRLLRRLGE